MDFFDLLLQAGLITALLVVYLIFFRKSSTKNRNYQEPGWNYPLKLLLARYAVKRWKSQLSTKDQLNEMPKVDQTSNGWDNITVRGSSSDGTAILLGIRKLCGLPPLAELTMYIKLADGTSYKLPQHPDTATGAWESITNGWSAGGLKIQILESQTRFRVLFNGLLTRVADNVTQHVKLNFIWASATGPVQHPKDWSNELAGQALALQPWRNGKWPYLLGKWDYGNWFQWGTVQGRFQSYDKKGSSDKSLFLRIRGVKERSWSPHGYQGLRRSVTITVTCHDGTAVQLRGLSYKEVLTQCFSGSVRFPNFTVEHITSTDLIMSDFCELADGIPKVYTVNVHTQNRHLKLVLRINADGGKLFSGVPYQQEIVYRTLIVDVNGVPGSGVLELGYEPTDVLEPSFYLTPPTFLGWLSEKEAGEVSYCLPFEAPAAACPNYVGGKGASLALLTSVQRDEGYRVPPGYCLTTRALERHFEMNPELKKAVSEIEAANKDYDEENFKEKCVRAAELFAATDIEGDVKDEILAHLNELKQKAMEENLGPELRFAVRSSAVGEDSEILSAAGQNETVLGCVTDADVLKGIQKCWGSMFAFTSAHYRRQNGQPCLCGGGVVIQVLIIPRAAGVMFTRHPEAGDPSRLLITANYGLGESVVSGSAEPDTIEVKRGKNGSLTISKIELGSKNHRVTAANEGVVVENVPEAERRIPCLTESEALILAQFGVLQEELWGAGRDIEWAISKNEIFLLQARPITSLERWSEDELLHELDWPIMSDDELITFANIGEVMPKAVTPLTYDLIMKPLEKSISRAVGCNEDGYEKSLIITHNKSAISLYSSIYRTVPKEIDMNIRMLEMCVHGHKVADDKIMSTALHRRQPKVIDKLVMSLKMIKCLISTKWRMKDSIKQVNNMNVDKLQIDDSLELLDNIKSHEKCIERVAYNHTITSSANTASQFITMLVFLEGGTDFTTEHCNEISMLLSSDDVLSAEVPTILNKLARELAESGQVEEFRAQDPKKVMYWLQKNLPHVHVQVDLLLKEHGHRALMEFDLATKPWVLEPEELMRVLQNVRPSDDRSQNTKSNKKKLASLKTPKKSSTKVILRWLLPLCHRTVRHREHTKAHLVLAVHKLRLALRRLSRLLVQQWYLPHEDLVFFFRLYELQDFIQTRDPALLRKAVQRHQYYPKWCKIKFNEINYGWPEPIKTTGSWATTGDAKIKATSVCGGEVVARACVIKDLSEIGQLQHGDILVTHSTDIGWSPYFPLLTGIVTELGGLISHGAVIAREYGLPCVVGAANATDIFKTGDLVRLSDGTIERVQIAHTSKTTESEEL